LLHENFQGFPGAAAESREQLSIIKKIAAQNLGNAEDEMPVGNLLENVHAQPFPEFHHALLVTGRAEVSSFTRERQQVLMAAVFAFHAGKAVAQIAAIQITADYLFDIGPPETIISGKPVIIDLHQGFKIVLYTVIIV